MKTNDSVGKLLRTPGLFYLSPLLIIVSWKEISSIKKANFVDLKALFQQFVIYHLNAFFKTLYLRSKDQAFFKYHAF